jgi:hypothetical protein
MDRKEKVMTPEIHAELDASLIKYMKQVAGLQKRVHEHNTKSVTKFFGQEDFYLKNGSLCSHEPLTPDEKTIIRTCMFLKKFKTKECFMNAANITCMSKGRPFTYCEGYAVGTLIPVQHAWVCLNGKALDVTWPIDFKKIRPPKNMDELMARIEHNLANGSYYGVLVPRVILAKHMVDGETYAPIIESPHDHFKLLREGADWLPEEL